MMEDVGGLVYVKVSIAERNEALYINQRTGFPHYAMIQGDLTQSRNADTRTMLICT
jgi:hypothetical protein